MFVRFAKYFALCLVAIGLLLTLWLFATDRAFIFRAIDKTYLSGFTTANINDYTAFKTNTIAKGETQSWQKADAYNKDKLSPELTDYLNKDRAAAFLVAHQGKLVSEHYFRGYSNNSETNSFSMAKSVLTLLVGIAIEDGVIKSWDQLASDFIPEFASDELGKTAQIKHFSTMTSGYDWVEHYYSAFSPTVQLYYGPDVENFLVNRNFKYAQDEVHYYSSASTQLLGIILSRALKQSGFSGTLSDYLSQKLWQPLGMNADGLWHTDDVGMELVYCCINTNARNYAKLGQLMLQNGEWQGNQLLPLDVIERARTPYGADNYGYSTWINQQNNPPYYWFSGHLGQYIIVVPSQELVIVKLGETRNADSFRQNDLPLLVENAIQLSQPQ